jgi:ABC-type antimicrobial peptide transport system permease subunit
MWLMTIFGGCALLLAAIGIYGLMAYSVQQRTQEIGIRLAIGADRREVLKMILRQGVILAVGGIAAGVGAALLLTRLMQSLLYEITPSDPITFVVVGVVLFVVALVASYLPAWRATRVSPLIALRTQ